MRVRSDLEVAPVLAFVHVRVDVAHDRVIDLPHRIRERRHRPHADHLVNRGSQWDRRAGHRGDARAPDAARDQHGLGVDVALIGADGADVAVLHVDAR